ncbi:hypothetical protein EV657_1151, partial [Rhodovulum visakhapatnamense]
GGDRGQHHAQAGGIDAAATGGTVPSSERGARPAGGAAGPFRPPRSCARRGRASQARGQRRRMARLLTLQNRHPDSPSQRRMDSAAGWPPFPGGCPCSTGIRPKPCPGDVARAPRGLAAGRTAFRRLAPDRQDPSGTDKVARGQTTNRSARRSGTLPARGASGRPSGLRGNTGRRSWQQSPARLRPPCNRSRSRSRSRSSLDPYRVAPARPSLRIPAAWQGRAEAWDGERQVSPQRTSAVLARTRAARSVLRARRPGRSAPPKAGSRLWPHPNRAQPASTLRNRASTTASATPAIAAMRKSSPVTSARPASR